MRLQVSAKSFGKKLSGQILLISILGNIVSASPQEISQKKLPPWQESLAPAAKGTRIAVPKPILRELKADPENCLDPSPTELEKMDAYFIRGNTQALVAVWGRGTCFCSPTGNCAFWLFRSRKGKYEKILDTDMVNQFGFVRSTTNGLQDLVLWSHGSAFDSGGSLWRFDGESYQQTCTWLRTSRKQNERGDWVDVRPYITESTCGSSRDN
jgi:hypothetical protein